VGPSAPSNAFTGTLTSGSASVTGVSSTAGLAAGDVVSGTGIPSGTTITAVNSSTSTVTLSANATTTGTANLTATVFIWIDNTKPTAVSDFRLNPADDTGIVGDNITTDRIPQFIGTAPAGDTVEVFALNQSGMQGLPVIASTTTSKDLDGRSYDFSIGLSHLLNEGQTTLYVEVVDPAGNVSGQSNPVTVAITSTAVDYIPSTTADPIGGSASDPALFIRNATTGQLEWLVQTPAGAAQPWFGASGVPYSSGPNTANVVPFSGDFDGDGLTDLAYYNPSNATWTIDESSKYQPFAFTGTLTSGSATVTGVSSSTGLTIGQDVAGPGIPAGTTILAINTLTQTIKLSANATAGGSQSLIATAPPITFTMGTANSSVPVVGNFDLNGPTEPAVFTINAQGQGVWTIASAITGTHAVTFGQTGDSPVPGDYNAAGYDQLAVYRPSTGQFLVYNPGSPSNPTVISIPGISTGVSGSSPSPDLSSLVPVPGQYDNLAYYKKSALQNQKVPIFGHTEAGVYDPKTGVFTILGPNGAYNVSGFQSGGVSAIPAVADYLGNGSDQVVAYQPSTGQFILGTVGSNGQTTLTTLATLGQSGDIPVIAPLSYRLPASGSGSGGGSSNTGSTGNGGSSNTGSTGNGGSSNTGSTGNGGSSSSSSSGSSQSGQGSPTPAPSPTPVSVSKHHKVVTKKKHPKHPVKAKKTKTHVKPAAHAVKKVHVLPAVQHKAGPAVQVAVASDGHSSKQAHVVDLALQDVHVNLRRSNGKQHGA
jgi:hypothetical protein